MMTKLKYLIALFLTLNLCLFSGAFGMQPDPDELTHSNVKAIMEEHLKKHPDILNSSKDKDIVVFLGNTGAGKSTLGNFLSGKPLKVDDFNEIVLENPNDLSAMAIGVSGDSQTFLPQSTKIDGVLFYDLPGFEDTRPSRSLVNACFIKSIIEKARSVKLIFVAGIGQVDNDRGKSVKELLGKTEQLIPNEIIANFSSLIITKSELPGDKLKDYLTRKVDVQSIQTLKYWRDNNKIEQMSKPNNRVIAQNEKAPILDLISSRTGSKKIKEVNIGAVYSNKDQTNIRKIYDAEIQGVIDQLIGRNFRSAELQNLDILSLKNKENYFQREFMQEVLSSLEKSSLIKLLCPISKDLYQESWSTKKRELNFCINEMVAKINETVFQKENIRMADLLNNAHNAIRALETQKDLEIHRAKYGHCQASADGKHTVENWYNHGKGTKGLFCQKCGMCSYLPSTYLNEFDKNALTRWR